MMQSDEGFSLVKKTIISVTLSVFVIIIGLASARTSQLCTILVIAGVAGVVLSILNVTAGDKPTEEGIANSESRARLFGEWEKHEERRPFLNDIQSFDRSRSASRYVPDVVNPPERPRTLYEPPTPTPPQEPEVRGHVIYQHAFDALQAANHTLDKSQPLPIDLGLIVYRGEAKPAIYRTHDVPDDADSIQPYVQLHVPLPLIESALVKVRFEIFNSSEQTLFNHEQVYTLKDNLNLIMPPARLAIGTLNMNYLWELRVSVGDKLLARHLFAWGEPPTEEVVTALEADGEISDEMRALLEEQAEESLSLDDLLANGDDQQKQRGS